MPSLLASPMAVQVFPLSGALKALTRRPVSFPHLRLSQLSSPPLLLELRHLSSHFWGVWEA